MAERGEAYLEYQRAYYQAHKEELQKRQREYYLANREKIRKAARERYYKLQAERMEKGEASCCRGKRMPKEELMPRCPYCDDEMKYVVLDMVKRTARLRCPTCDSEFPSREEESDDDD